MTELTHTSEDLLNKLRKGDFIADGKVIDILIEAHNAAKTLLQRIKNHNLQPLDLDIISRESASTRPESPGGSFLTHNNSAPSRPSTCVSPLLETSPPRRADPGRAAPRAVRDIRASGSPTRRRRTAAPASRLRRNRADRVSHRSRATPYGVPRQVLEGGLVIPAGGNQRPLGEEPVVHFHVPADEHLIARIHRPLETEILGRDVTPVPGRQENHVGIPMNVDKPGVRKQLQQQADAAGVGWRLQHQGATVLPREFLKEQLQALLPLGDLAFRHAAQGQIPVVVLRAARKRPTQIRRSQGGCAEGKLVFGGHPEMLGHVVAQPATWAQATPAAAHQPAPNREKCAGTRLDRGSDKRTG